MWEDVELRQLRVFLTLADRLHFGRTAESLGLTTSRVSQILRSLERDLGVRLVHRTSRRVELTPDGERLRTDLAPTYEQLGTVLAAAAAPHRELAGTVNLGVLGWASGGTRLERLIDLFTEQCPGCAVNRVELPFTDRTGPLHRGECDLILTRVPIDDPAVHLGPVLSRDPRVVLLRHDHPLATLETVSIEDVADHEVLDVRVDPRSLPTDLVPRTTPRGRELRRSPARVTSISELVDVVARGDAVHLAVPAFAASLPHPHLVSRPVDDLPPSASALAWLRATRDRRVLALADLVAQLPGR